MPVAEPARAHRGLATGIIAMLALTGCQQSTPTAEAPGPDPPPATAAPVYTAPADQLDPDAELAESSYEVAIATAAANRKRALEECDRRPEDEREDCSTQVETDWEIAKSAVGDLRGEQ